MSIQFESDFDAADWSIFNYDTGGGPWGEFATSPTYCSSAHSFTGANQGGNGLSASFTITASAEIYFRFYGYYNSSSLDGYIMSFFPSTSDWCNRLNISSGKLQALRQLDNINIVTLATATSAFPQDAWHLVEGHVKFSTGTDGVFDLRVDGAYDPYGFQFTGRTVRMAGQETCNAVQLQNPGTFQTWFFDNLQVNNTSGSTDNSWPGPVACGNSPEGYWGVLVG